jgi:hypothetical protein
VERQLNGLEQRILVDFDTERNAGGIYNPVHGYG